MSKIKLYISSLFILGFSTFLVQVVLLREYLAVYNGNEIGIGLFLGSWMFSNGIGAFFGNRFIKSINKTFGLLLFHALFAFLPFLSSFLGFYLKGTFFHAGQMPGMADLVWINFLYLFPFCFVAGTFFPFTAFLISDINKKNKIGKAYAIESIGAVTGAFLINILVLRYVDHKTILLVNLILNLINFGLYYFTWKKFYLAKSLLVILIIAAGVFVYEFDSKSVLGKYLYQGQEIEQITETKYGSIIETSYQESKNIFLNNSLVYTEHRLKENEELAHFAMLQSKNPKSVLVYGGFDNLLFDEILKYQVEKIDYVEANEALVNKVIAERDKLDYYAMNLSAFLKKTNKKYDVILLNVGNPETVSQHVYFTDENFLKLKEKLTKNGVLATYIDVNYKYLSEAESVLTSIVYRTLKKSFEYVKLVTGEHLYFISSNVNLKESYLPILEKQGLDNSYVNEFYISDEEIQRNEQNILNSLNDRISINKNHKPLALNAALNIWSEKSGMKYLIWTVIFVLVVILFVQMNSIVLPVFVAGFTGASIQTILIILFQIYFGNLYHFIGLLMGLFMVGLFIGAYFTNEKEITKKSKSSKLLLITVNVELILVLVLTDLLLMNASYFIGVILFLNSLLFGVLLGRIFSVVSFKSNKSLLKTGSHVYGIDMIGASLGAILISVILIPQFGIIFSCFILLIISMINIIFK